MDNDDFANVSWQSDGSTKGKGVDQASLASDQHRTISPTSMNGKSRGSSHGVLGRNADEMDLAGLGDAVLECTVTQPIKENDGTKDAYVSYLVTTNVRIHPAPFKEYARNTDMNL